jgi:hypothetical protein
MSFMQDITQQAILQRLAANSGEQGMAVSIQDDLGTGTLKVATEALPEATTIYFERISDLLKQPQSPERDAQIARQSKLQAIVEDAWAARIVKLSKR